MISDSKGHISPWLALMLMVSAGPLRGQQTLELDNDTLHLELDLTRGGAISYISRSGTNRNIVNIHDEGRYIQQSYYAGEVLDRTDEGQNPSWSPWPWNPIQVGDSYWNRAEILESGKQVNTLYVKCHPMLWDMNNEPAEAIMEQWTTLRGNVLEVRNRLTCERLDDIWGEGILRDQELPAVYPISTLKHLYSYFGPLPWTGAPLDKPEVVHLEDGIWGRYLGDVVTESWMAFVDDNLWGIGVYSPLCTNFLAGMAGSPGYEASDGPTSYIAPVKQVALNKHSVFEYTYWLVVGSLHQIRSRIYSIRGVQENAWEFRDDTEGWHVDPTGGTVKHADSCLSFHVTGEGSSISKLVDAWEAGSLRYLWVNLKNETEATLGAFSFFSVTGDSVRIPYMLTPSDTTWQDVLIDLDSVSFWNQDLVLDRLQLHPVAGNDTGRVSVDFIRFLESLVRIRAEGDVTEIRGLGNSLQLYAEQLPAMTALEVDWSVDQPEVAGIDAGGLLTAVSGGIVTIAALAKDRSGPPGRLRIVITDTAQVNAWEFEEDLEGWDKNPHGGDVSWSGGALKFTVTGDDPYVSNHLGSWSAGALKYLWIRIKNETAGTSGAMYLFPSGGGHDFALIPLTPNDTAYRDIYVDMREAAVWDKDPVLDMLRLDPNNGGETGVVYVDFIRFLETPLAVPGADAGDFPDGNARAAVYPNPAGGIIHVRHAADVVSVVIFTLAGQALMRASVEGADPSIDIGRLAPGIYLLRTRTSDGREHTYHFIKQ